MGIAAQQKGQVEIDRTCPGAQCSRRIRSRAGFSQADDAFAFLPLAAFLEQFNALEALENVALHGDAFADCRLLCWDMT